jgi:hypothetical protein
MQQVAKCTENKYGTIQWKELSIAFVAFASMLSEVHGMPSPTTYLTAQLLTQLYFLRGMRTMDDALCLHSYYIIS